jgi:hypothetical protein
LDFSFDFFPLSHAPAAMAVPNLARGGGAGGGSWRPFIMPLFMTAAFTGAASSSCGLHRATLYDLVVDFYLRDFV